MRLYHQHIHAQESLQPGSSQSPTTDQVMYRAQSSEETVQGDRVSGQAPRQLQSTGFMEVFTRGQVIHLPEILEKSLRPRTSIDNRRQRTKGLVEKRS